ncbi:hypothetical protein [Sinanaerobacter chloroacetimidivorans]|uniref:Uncharacterized protein n=1 Tax=Sinanaerobacter chloroacetimidivorans TaxID=2818044 RepID=A0A8J7VXL9_9FIRM|nr:hypothetical protein [Sinanaerobacter chloroacetimidivorans]MBR0596957.1 hypothetical protein [Sinanaerobacter chloroacetimidivorans]
MSYDSGENSDAEKKYNAKEKYLYEILEDYQFSDHKEEIFEAFINSLWECPNKRLTITKYIKFRVLPELSPCDTGRIFQNYQSIPYRSYRNSTTEKNYVDLIRQKINNLYSIRCDPDICTEKEYMNLLKTPKRLYYLWRKGEEIPSANELSEHISHCMEEAECIRKLSAKSKLKLSWSEYQELISEFLCKIFDNYIPLEAFEKKEELYLDVDIWLEDHFIIRYICKSLDGYMSNYIKNYYGIRRGRNVKIQRCSCGGLFLQNKKNNRFKCNLCNKYQPIETKVITCISCGKQIELKGIVKNKKRCNDCQKSYNRKIKTEKQRIYRTRQ